MDALDWSEAVDRLRRENEALASINVHLAAEKLGLERENAKLKEALEKAQERIDEWERTAARQAAPFRRREALKVAERKRPGRPAGHQGMRRERPRHVDQVVEAPLTACPHCGGAVHDRAPLTQYIEELPPVRPVVTRLTTWKGVCPQGGEVHSTHPLQVSQAQGGVERGRSGSDEHEAKIRPRPRRISTPGSGCGCWPAPSRSPEIATF